MLCSYSIYTIICSTLLDRIQDYYIFIEINKLYYIVIMRDIRCVFLLVYYLATMGRYKRM